MQKRKHQNDREKQNQRPDWDGLSNEPRNENLARIRGLGSFEKDEYYRESESNPNLQHPTVYKHKD